MRPRALIPIAPGTNRDHDLAVAFKAAGAEAESVPLSALRSGEVRLDDFQMLGVPGGFSYGDALGAGRLLGLDLAGWFADQLRDAVAREMPIIGVCNGFQALVAAGLLPGTSGQETATDQGEPANAVLTNAVLTNAVLTNAVLTKNASNRFECRWVTLDPTSSRSVWTRDLTEPLRCPVAHGEGRFVADDLAAIEADDRIAFRYVNADGTPADGDYPANPNGSAGDVAGVCDPSGLVVGLMPHPEDHVFERQDPLRGRTVSGSCLPLFAAGVAAVSE